MGVGAGLYMYVVVVQKFTFAISSPHEFLSSIIPLTNKDNLLFIVPLHQWSLREVDIRSYHLSACPMPL